ncbi:ABC transporter substrate-binding protein [Planosporangium sp. 12N6]|uniref:ABC transporter substrate-binding protein n=1 Tax=Planosporangium spinosum TaxID=3402278 RepID=UPI003CEEC4CF
MNVPSSRLRNATVVALAAVTVLGMAAGCSKKNDAEASGGKIKLVVDTFGEFGYEDLYKQYESTHSNIKIESRVINKLDDHKANLLKNLAAGSGAGDVVALEEGIIGEFKQQMQNFVDLKQYGADGLSADYLKWKFDQARTKDGQIVGLPTDVGGLAVCYRRDLFEKAKLPTDRQAVSGSWKTWDDFIATGEKFKAANTGGAFLDTATTAFSAVLFQAGSSNFYDDSDKLIADTSSTVKKSWDTSMAIDNKGLTAKISTWSDPWSAGFKNGSFAVTFCPSWMRGIIQTNSGPENAGKWDVASVPGGGGNWGGSWLAVTKQSKHPKEAYELAKFLTSKEGQIAAFNAKGPLPTNLAALDDSAVTGKTDPYFNNAPVGQIYATGAKSLQQIHLGPRHQAIKEHAFEPAIQSVEQGKATPDEAWKNAQEAAKKEAK